MVQMEIPLVLFKNDLTQQQIHGWEHDVKILFNSKCSSMYNAYSEVNQLNQKSLLNVVQQIHDVDASILAYAFPPNFRDLQDTSVVPVVIATDPVYTVLLNLQALAIINIILKNDATAHKLYQENLI